MRFEAFIAARYLRSKRKNRFVNLIAIISVAGVAVGVIALIVIMSVMAGFDNELRAAVVGNRAHLKLTLPGGGPMLDYAPALAALAAQPEVVAAAPYVELESLLQHGSDSSGAVIMGIDPERESKVTDLAVNLTHDAGRTFGQGALPKAGEAVLGYRLAQHLGARLGSEIAVVAGKPITGPFGMRGGNQVTLKVCGISEARMLDFDTLYSFVDLPTMRRITGRDSVDGVHARLRDPFLAEPLAKRLNAQGKFTVKTWYEDQEAFFQALKVEKVAMFTILVFIILVAAFSITSTLIMIVMEKRRDVGILRTLGADSRSIVLVFVMEGLFIGLGGTVAGVVAGVLLAYNLNPVASTLARLAGVDLYNTTLYYYEGIPVAIAPADVAWVAAAAAALTFLATVYPAWSAARLNPVDALRYE